MCVKQSESEGVLESKMTNSSSTDHEGLRLRRTQSVTRAEEIQAVEQKIRKSQPDKPYVKNYSVFYLILHIVIFLGSLSRCAFNGQCRFNHPQM